MNDNSKNQTTLSSQPLSIDVDSIISSCSSWEKEIKSINIKSFPVSNTLSPLTSNRIAVEIKDELEKIFEINENSLISTIAAIKNFCEEQIRISEVEEVEEEVDVVVSKKEDYQTVTSNTATITDNDTSKVGNVFTGSTVKTAANISESSYNKMKKELLSQPISNNLKMVVLTSNNNNLDNRIKDFFADDKQTKRDLYAIINNQLNRVATANNFSKDSLFRDEEKYKVFLSSISNEKEILDALLSSDNFKYDLVTLYYKKASLPIADMLLTISLKTNTHVDDLMESNSDYLKYKISELQKTYTDIIAVSNSDITKREEILESLFGE